MTIRSMTGYGAAQGRQDGWTLTAEIRSANHRTLDLRINAPSSLWAFEPAVRDLVKRHCNRGRIDCRLEIEHSGPLDLTPAAFSQVQQLYTTLTSIQEHLGLEGPIALSDLIAAGMNPLGLAAVSLPPEVMEGLLVSVVGEALRSLVVSREREGQALCLELLSRVERSMVLLDRIEVDASGDREANLSNLRGRIEDLLGRLGISQPLETDRLYQEIAFQLERSDTTEEIVRCRSHVAALRSQLEGRLAPSQTMGKGIDFLLQELTRETNTMAAKSDSAEITRDILEMKLEIERMREQIQNIE